MRVRRSAHHPPKSLFLRQNSLFLRWRAHYLPRARYALSYGGMKRTRKQLVWKETGGSLVRGHTRYEANAGQGKYEISPYSELQRNGSEPKFGGYSIRRYPTKTSTIKDARTLKSSAKTADEAKAMAQRDHERGAS